MSDDFVNIVRTLLGSIRRKQLFNSRTIFLSRMKWFRDAPGKTSVMNFRRIFLSPLSDSWLCVERMFFFMSDWELPFFGFLPNSEKYDTRHWAWQFFLPSDWLLMERFFQSIGRTFVLWSTCITSQLFPFMVMQCLRNRSLHWITHSWSTPKEY